MARMRNRLWRRALMLLMATHGAVAAAGPAPVQIPADDPGIRYIGRVDDRDALAPAFGWPSSAIVANFEGTSIRARFDDEKGKNLLQIIVDGGSPTVLALGKGPAQYTLASGLAEGTHRVEVVKRTEGYFGAVRFLGFQLDAGRRLAAPTPRQRLKIEFYGDSNVAGYSSESIGDVGQPRFENNYFAYPGITARMLDAEYQCIGWSGATIAPGSSLPVQSFWNRVLPQDSNLLWDFSRFDADVVVINVGSNDSYDGDNRDAVMAGWQDLITNHIRVVHPRAHVVLADSYGWSFDEPANYLDDMVQRLHAQGDVNVSSVRWPWLWGQAHAVVEEQAGFANVLAPHIAQHLGLPAPKPSPLSSFAGPGRLFNPSFEVVPVGQGRAHQAAGWREGATPGASVAVVTDAASAAAGARYVRLQVRASGTAKVWQAMDVQPGRTYTLRGQARGTAGHKAQMQIVFKDQGQNVIARSFGVVTLADRWTPAVTAATAPPGAWSVNVQLRLADKHTRAMFDALSLSSR